MGSLVTKRNNTFTPAVAIVTYSKLILGSDPSAASSDSAKTSKLTQTVLLKYHGLCCFVSTNVPFRIMRV